ncbi:MAG: AMP-binding protein, partial [Bradyrhizobium sp.]|nr:AMP-binding protein [Bradyrhizobium sp.]
MQGIEPQRSRSISFEGRPAVTEVSNAVEIDQIAAALPRRLHAVMDRFVQETPEHIALVEDGDAWSYRDLDRHVEEVARQLASLGVRAGDRMMIVSENCIALAALLFAASRLGAWAIVANPRLSAREIDQIRDHS